MAAVEQAGERVERGLRLELRLRDALLLDLLLEREAAQPVDLGVLAGGVDLVLDLQVGQTGRGLLVDADLLELVVGAVVRECRCECRLASPGCCESSSWQVNSSMERPRFSAMAESPPRRRAPRRSAPAPTR